MPEGCLHLAADGHSRPCSFCKAGLSNWEIARGLDRAPVDDSPETFAQQGEEGTSAPSSARVGDGAVPRRDVVGVEDDAGDVAYGR